MLNFLTEPRGGGFGFKWETMKPWWERASEGFAEGAEGPSLRFQGVDPTEGATWNTIESVILALRNVPVYQIPF